jgi:Pyruvate/2-oxoacid:ferredoxin oxidoreductase delta subunit
MCEFCVKHGEGRKWYLNAKNYAEDLLSDIKRRKRIEDFLTNPRALAVGARSLAKVERAPAPLRRALSRLVTGKMKKVHFGQVLPIEEIEKIFTFVNSVVRIACICRHITTKKEGRYCYGLSLAAQGGKLAELLSGLDESFINGPDSAGLELLTKEQTLAALRQHEQEGLCHTIWTFDSPFICCICNCSSNDCLAIKSTIGHGVALMFPAEQQAAVHNAACSGCGRCIAACQFRALRMSNADGKARVDAKACYGCGLCRGKCPNNALSLVERPGTASCGPPFCEDGKILANE